MIDTQDGVHAVLSGNCIKRVEIVQGFTMELVYYWLVGGYYLLVLTI